jgi:6-pyruvoyl-tetrahydropterin synthase
MSTLFVRKLCVMDLSYLHPARGLLGESWIVDIELDGSLDHQGMVLDFGEVKRQVKQAIDGHFDHKLLVPGSYPGTSLELSEHRARIEFKLEGGGHIVHQSPLSAITVIDSDRIDTGTLTDAIIDCLTPILPDNVEAIRLRLHTEQIDGAWYQYSHGLKHHGGNCQRIAHGHRSRLEIYRNGERDERAEDAWARAWHDIYIATRTDLLERYTSNAIEFYRFGYTANQGLFEIELPAANCYLIDTDSTVENLAQHIAHKLKQEHPDSSFEVHAYEGVDKGAVGRA